MKWKRTETVMHFNHLYLFYLDLFNGVDTVFVDVDSKWACIVFFFSLRSRNGYSILIKAFASWRLNAMKSHDTNQMPMNRNWECTKNRGKHSRTQIRSNGMVNWVLHNYLLFIFDQSGHCISLLSQPTWTQEFFRRKNPYTHSVLCSTRWNDQNVRLLLRCPFDHNLSDRTHTEHE